MRERGVCSTLSADRACNRFVLLGVRNCAASVEGCSISQRFQCRSMAASVLSRKCLLRAGNVDLTG